MATVETRRARFGDLLRVWRQRRHLSQLQLATSAGLSARHLSFVETGRSRPSRELLLHLAEHLEVPLREQNAMLVAAGYAPVFPEHDLDAPAMGAVREALAQLLDAHEPYPAVVVDRHWNLVLANSALGLLADLVSPELLAPPVNVVRVSLHPDGLAPHVRNLEEYSAHVLGRLRRQVEITGDPILGELLDEVTGYAGVPRLAHHDDEIGVVLPLRLGTPDGDVSLFTTIATFGAPLDVTLSELAIEAFYPADAETAALLRRRAATI
jgi:transcriptional regulator with XRE-family HTH domain